MSVGCVNAVVQNGGVFTSQWQNEKKLKPSILSEACETEEFDETFPSNKEDDEASEATYSSSMSLTYPPTGTLLEEIVCYRQTSKRLPLFIVRCSLILRHFLTI